MAAVLGQPGGFCGLGLCLGLRGTGFGLCLLDQGRALLHALAFVVDFFANAIGFLAAARLPAFRAANTTRPMTTSATRTATTIHTTLLVSMPAPSILGPITLTAPLIRRMPGCCAELNR